MTIKEYMEIEYPGLVYDGALPQQWVDTVISLSGIDPVGHFTWCYPPGNYFGAPCPVSDTGERILIGLGVMFSAQNMAGKR